MRMYNEVCWFKLECWFKPEAFAGVRAMAGRPGVYGKRSYDELTSEPQIPSQFTGMRGFREGLQPMRMCTYFLLGRCTKGEACTFAHNSAELKMCEFFLLGRCLKGNGCNFAHTRDELNGGLQAHQSQGGFRAQKNQTEVMAQPGHEAGLMQQQQGTAGIAAQPYGVANRAAMNYHRFEDGQVPTLLCKNWLYHPSFCMAADTCTFAHGLAEMQLGSDAECVATTPAPASAASTDADVAPGASVVTTDADVAPGASAEPSAEARVDSSICDLVLLNMKLTSIDVVSECRVSPSVERESMFSLQLI